MNKNKIIEYAGRSKPSKAVSDKRSEYINLADEMGNKRTNKKKEKTKNEEVTKKETNIPYYYSNAFSSTTSPTTMEIEDYQIPSMKNIKFTYDGETESLLYFFKMYYNWFLSKTDAKDIINSSKPSLNSCVDFMYNLTQIIKGYIFGLTPTVSTDEDGQYIKLSSTKLNNNCKYFEALCYRLLDWWKIYVSLTDKRSDDLYGTLKLFSELLCNSIDAIVEVKGLDSNLYRYPEYINESLWTPVFIIDTDIKNDYASVIKNKDYYIVINNLVPRLEEYVTKLPSTNYFIPVRTLIANEIYYICVSILVRLDDVNRYERRNVENELEGFMERVQRMDITLKFKQTINNVTIEKYLRSKNIW